MKRMLFVFVLLAILLSASGVFQVRAQSSYTWENLEPILKSKGIKYEYQPHEPGLLDDFFGKYCEAVVRVNQTTPDLSQVTGWTWDQLGQAGYALSVTSATEYGVRYLHFRGLNYDKYCKPPSGGSGEAMVPEMTQQFSWISLLWGLLALIAAAAVLGRFGLLPI